MCIRSKVSNELLKFQHMWDGHMGWEIKQKKQNQIPFRRGKLNPLSIILGRPTHSGIWEAWKSTKYWWCIQSNRSKTEYAEPVASASTIDGSLRSGLDYCKLNAVTSLYSYHIPCKNRCTKTLGDVTAFLTLNAKSSYWEVEVPDGDRRKMVFPSHCS